MEAIQSRFATLLGRNADGEAPPPLTPALAARLRERIDAIRLFAHGYAFLTNVTHGRMKPADLLDFAYRNELDGLCLHVLDGEANSLSRMTPADLRAFGEKAQALGLALHLEISTTRRDDVDRVVAIARGVGARDIRVYSRYEGMLSAVLEAIEVDLRRLAALAEANDLHFDFEQHEELKSFEIAELLRRVGSPRLNALFDFGNMINACERPLPALRALAPFIRQVHLKGVRIVPEGNGFGHRGVLQGGLEDDLPDARMLFELLMLGEPRPQVIAFALEQENHYVAPAFRQSDEAEDPFIPYREMSETHLPFGGSLERMLTDEPRWAENQLRHVRTVLSELRLLCELVLAETRAAAPLRLTA